MINYINYKVYYIEYNTFIIMPPKKAPTKKAPAKKSNASTKTKTTTSTKTKVEKKSFVTSDDFIRNKADGKSCDEKKLDIPKNTRMFGAYKCCNCGSDWMSARTFSGRYQRCMKCGYQVYPESANELRKKE